MNSLKGLIISIFLIALIVESISAFAVSSPTLLSVHANQKMIGIDNSVTISGNIAPSLIKNDTNLLVKVFNPLGELYLSDSLNLNNTIFPTGTYRYSFDFNGKPSMPGNYEIMVTSGVYDAETLVTYLSGNNDPYSYYAYVVKISNQTYPIRYKITQGSEVEFMSVLPAANLLRIGVDSNSDNGTLTIELPRSVIDAKQNAADIDYTVKMVQGKTIFSKTAAHVTKIASSITTRTLQIGLENGPREIWIYGTRTASGEMGQNENMTATSSLLQLPLQQFRSGTLAKDVKCRYDLTLVLKSQDGSPACVKSEDVAKLVERGWTKI